MYTLREITGKESGVIVYYDRYRSDSAFAVNWANDTDEYDTYEEEYVPDCKQWLIDNVIYFNGVLYVNNKTDDNITIDSFDCPGMSYKFDEFYVLVPNTWE